MTRKYCKDNSGIDAETIGQLEQMISFTGSNRRNGSQKIVLETIIWTNRAKREINKDLNWNDVDRGMNTIVPSSIQEARQISDKISAVAPVTTYRKKMLIESSVKISVQKLVAAHHAGFEETECFDYDRR